MKQSKIYSLFLSILMMVSCFSIVTPIYADEDQGSSSDNGIHVEKNAIVNPDGSYTISLEAYATGSKIISVIDTDVPTDIVLVLDQSGSMARSMTLTDFRPYQNESNGNLYLYRNNGGEQNLYYQLSDGSYSKVNVTYSDSEVQYTEISQQTYTSEYYQMDNLYACIDGIYYPVEISYEWVQSGWNSGWKYVYRANGKIIGTTSRYYAVPSFSGIDGNCLYTMSADESNRIYSYTYTDVNGEQQQLKSTGVNRIPDFTLYQAYSDTSKTRLDSLVDAVTLFVEEVQKKAAGADENINTTEDNINHRIAIVGFSSSGYNNTELLTGNAITTGTDYYGTSPSTSGSYYYFPTGYEKNGPNYYDEISDDQYKNALQDMDTVAGVNNVNVGINSITAYGGTQTHIGIEMANKVFEQNPIDASEEKRNRVLIIFTDGAPGNQGDWGDESISVAQNAIKNSYTSKNEYLASVYTIGIFDGADASSPSLLPTYSTRNLNSTKRTANSNRFMHLLSSNYLKASAMDDENTGEINPDLDGDSFYLSASDSDALNEIFKKISKEIESGGSSTTLGSEAVIKDVISPQFELPQGTTVDNVSIETYSYKGVDTWVKNDDESGAHATISGDQVSVTGFDFSENYVGTVTEADGSVTYRGKKLVISFKVVPKSGFLGGNNVFTNSFARVYKNSLDEAADKEDNPTYVVEFNKPEVNVSIKDISLNTTDKNIYLLSAITGAELKEGTEIKCGDVDLQLSKPNFGLQEWQNQYVNIEVVVKDETGKEIEDISNLQNLSDDQIYTISVSISPNTNGSGADGTPATAQSGNSSSSINVFKPVVTFKDSTVFYGEASPSDYSYNTVSTVWKHGETSSTDTGVTMIGTVPTLDLTFTPEAGKITDNIINTKQDIGVNVTAKIGDKELTPENGLITYGHVDCKESEILNDFEFWLHVNTGTLKIQKIGGADKEPYLFEVFKKNGDSFVKYTEATITFDAYATEENANSVTIYELPAGEYKVVEDTNWSWRYEVEKQEYDPVITYENSNNSTSISSLRANASATITNKKTLQYWLNGFSDVVRNVFGVSKP